MTKSPFIYWCLKDIKLDLGQPNQNKLFPELLNLSLWVRMKCFANVSPAQKHHNRVSFSRDEAEQEDITAAAVIALQKPSLPAVRPYAASPPYIWPSPSGSQYDWENKCDKNHHFKV